jgi:uncharacterized repeat protein (TIGR03803 family)
MVETYAKSAFARLVPVLWAAACLPFSAGALTPVYSFTNGFDGSQPYAGLTPGNDGNFYGTTFSGGTNHFGSVFKITPDGQLTPLHSFSFIDGETPTAALVQGADGNFYGTTFSGGSSNFYGTVFQIATNGAFTSLYSFTNGPDGGEPYAGLAQDGAGVFYGTTFAGGSNGYGGVFQITSAGALTPLYSFTNGADGAQPDAGLLLGGDGNFYGTTTTGGSNGAGTVFKITPGGALTPLYSFTNGLDGAEPVAALAQGANGLLYGAAYSGGSSGNGTLFDISTNGAFTALYSFSGGIDGACPGAALAPGNDGNFYGTTYAGGSNGNGGLFKITPRGAFTPIYVFTGGADGSSSYALLAPGSDGNFYGTTQYGGRDGVGVVFKINVYSSVPVMTSITRSSRAIGITWSGLPQRSYQAQYATNLTQTTWSDLGGIVTATNGFGSQTDSAPAGAQRFYRVYLVP